VIHSGIRLMSVDDAVVIGRGYQKFTFLKEMKINFDRKECNFRALKFNTEFFFTDKTEALINSKDVC
jgi:hypothetical protein